MKKKSLGIYILSSLVIGNMIGSGIFLLPASLASFGTITIFSWCVTALGAMLLALVFSKLSTLFPKTGGPYIYCKEGFGSFIGFQVAYNYWVYMWVGNAAIAVAFTGYLSVFWPALATDQLLAFFVTAGAVWVFTSINMIGVHFAGIFQLILTIFKFFPLFVTVCIGFFFIRWENLTFFNMTQGSDLKAFSGGAMLTLWAFLGMESASIPADEVKHPEKTIPRATLLGTGITALIYILSTVVIMGVVPIPELQNSTAPFADLAGKIFGQLGSSIIAFVAIVSCLGALNGWILLQGQIPLAAAKDHLFPKKFAYLTKNRSPVFGIVLSSILITFLLALNFTKGLVDQFTFIISLATLSAIIAYLYTTIAEFVIYIKHPDKIDKKHVAKSLVISMLAFIYTFWMVCSCDKDIVFYGVILMFTSIPIYGYMEWKKYQKKFSDI